MVYAEIGTVGAKLFSRDRQIDRLVQRVTCCTRLRMGGVRPVAERQEADFLHWVQIVPTRTTSIAMLWTATLMWLDGLWPDFESTNRGVSKQSNR